MTWHSEPTGQELEAARAAVFLAETKRAMRGSHSPDVILQLQVESTGHNQRGYRVHATIDDLPITPPEGHYLHPITGTPHATARMLIMYARNRLGNTQPGSVPAN
ncbi:hypothetical protein ACFRJ9_19650 [Paenarthrobacter sp. NPDC056912]|uniref:hypothetical protein n=1 Tax=Paenarthrobacter sp. NPDC056912 TaxID=3345965 RepID=UPI00366EB800